MSEPPLKHEDPLGDWVREKIGAESSSPLRLFARIVLLILGTCCLYGIVRSGFWPGGWSLDVALQSSGLLVAAAICFHGLLSR